MFLSLYNLELNLIDELLGLLKSSIISNLFFPTLPKVRVAVNKFIDKINIGVYYNYSMINIIDMCTVVWTFIHIHYD